ARPPTYAARGGDAGCFQPPLGRQRLSVRSARCSVAPYAPVDGAHGRTRYGLARVYDARGSGREQRMEGRLREGGGAARGRRRRGGTGGPQGRKPGGRGPVRLALQSALLASPGGGDGARRSIRRSADRKSVV